MPRIKKKEPDCAPDTRGVITNDSADPDDVTFIAPLLDDACDAPADILAAINKLDIENESPADLDSFRSQWKQEIQGRLTTTHGSTETVDEPEHEVKAKTLFLEGVELERRGEMAEAVSRFSRAVKLVPDIERRMFTPGIPSSNQNLRSRSASAPRKPDSSTDFYDLRSQCAARILERGTNFEPASSGYACHLQDIPVELIRLLLRYVAGSRVDARAIETLSEVSSMFYLLAREDELWRVVLARSVGVEYARALIDEEPNVSCRDIYLDNPHLLYDGVYVSKSTYIRHGETGFQDQHYRPWHTITYYRLMRFYADGTLLMTTSSEVPQVAVSALRHKTPLKSDSGVLVGNWVLEEGYDVVAKVKRDTELPAVKVNSKRNKVEVHEEYGISRHEFALQLRLERRGLRWGLHWVNNECTITRFDGSTTSTDMDADKDSQAFPPLRYYRVKSFADGSDSKL